MGGNRKRFLKPSQNSRAKRVAIGSSLPSPTTRNPGPATRSADTHALEDIAAEDKLFETYLNGKSAVERSAFSADFADEAPSEAPSDAEDTLADQEDDYDEVAHHSKELEDLKTADPSFYQYLLENDRAILGFGEDCRRERYEAAAATERSAEPEDEKGVKSKWILTSERFKLLRQNAIERKTVRGLCLLLEAYKGVVRSVTEIEAATAEGAQLLGLKSVKKQFKEKKGLKSPKSAASKKVVKNEDEEAAGVKRKPPLFRINLEGSEREAAESIKLFNEVVVSVAEHISALLSVHVPVKESCEGKIFYPKKSAALKKRFLMQIGSFWNETALLLKYFCGKVDIGGISVAQQVCREPATCVCSVYFFCRAI